MSESITNKCLTELGRVKKARSAKNRNRAVDKWQKCLENSSGGRIKTGYKFSKKEKKKLKEGKKI
jgi:hypothetical protein